MRASCFEQWVERLLEEPQLTTSNFTYVCKLICKLLNNIVSSGVTIVESCDVRGGWEKCHLVGKCPAFGRRCGYTVVARVVRMRVLSE